MLKYKFKTQHSLIRIILIVFRNFFWKISSNIFIDYKYHTNKKFKILTLILISKKKILKKVS